MGQFFWKSKISGVDFFSILWKLIGCSLDQVYTCVRGLAVFTDEMVKTLFLIE